MVIDKTSVFSHSGLPLTKLEENFLIQRCGLTFTDLLHTNNQFNRWDKELAEIYINMMARLAGQESTQMIEHLFDKGVRLLTMELLKRLLGDVTGIENIDTCPVCQTLLKNLFTEGDDNFILNMVCKYPVIGIGAPINFFLPQAAEIIGAKVLLPKDADVANAIGAITSHIHIKKSTRIRCADQGGFLVEGTLEKNFFRDFHEADKFAQQHIVAAVRKIGEEAGTSCRTVTLTFEDKIPKTAHGESVFVERVIKASLEGKPDLVVH